MLCACTTVSCTIPPSRIFSPEVTLVGSHGSDRVCIRSRYILHYYYTTIVVVPLRMTDKAIGSDMTPKGSLGCAHGSRQFGGVPVLSSGVLTGNDVTRRIPSDARMRNRKFGFTILFSGVLTGSDVTCRGFPRVRAYGTESWEFLPIRECFPSTFSLHMFNK